MKAQIKKRRKSKEASPRKDDATVVKNRIAACSRATMQARPEIEVWMALRQKAVTAMPEARAHHAAAVFGAGLFVHGGLTGDGRTLGDWNVFDFGLQVWIRCQVDEIDLEDERPKGEPPLANYTRKNHTLTPVVE